MHIPVTVIEIGRRYMTSLLKKYLVAFITVLGATVCVSLIVFQTEKEPDQETLTIGLQSGYPPFEYRDESGQIVGFDIDVAELIAAKLGKKLVVKDMDFDAEILSLKQGKIDLIVSGMNITPSREKEIFMVPYHGTATSLSLIFWEAIPKGVKTIDDLIKLPHHTITVGTGTTSEHYLTQYPALQPKSLEGALSCLMDVKYGKSLANLVESDVAQYLQTQHPQIKILEVPLEKNETIAGVGIGVNKKNQALYETIRETIEGLKATGELTQLEDKWFK